MDAFSTGCLAMSAPNSNKNRPDRRISARGIRRSGEVQKQIQATLYEVFEADSRVTVFAAPHSHQARVSILSSRGVSVVILRSATFASAFSIEARGHTNTFLFITFIQI